MNEQRKEKILYYSEGDEDILGRNFTIYRFLDHGVKERYQWILEEETFSDELIFEMNINTNLPLTLIKREKIEIKKDENNFFPNLYRQIIEVEANNNFDSDTIYAPFSKLVIFGNRLFTSSLSLK